MLSVCLSGGGGGLVQAEFDSSEMFLKREISLLTPLQRSSICLPSSKQLWHKKCPLIPPFNRFLHLFPPGSGIPAPPEPVCRHQDGQEHHGGNGQGEGRGFEKDAVEIHGGILTLAPSGSFRLKIVWKEREVGDPGSSCKYNLFISDSGCGIIKVALSQREGVCFCGLAYFWR